MSDFDSLLDSAVDAGGLPTEDLLATMLPLMRQVAVVHAAQRVAPLDGTAALRVESGQLWFEDARAEKPRSNIAVIRRLLHPRQSGVDVVEETTLTAGEPEDSDAREALPIGRRGEAITRPVYLPGFSCWELALEHHDPVTDVFSLGMLLAALACGVDLGERAGLESFVVHRRRLFELNDRLHPVIAKAIMEMTELDRHRRPQDVAALVHALENYREQAVDLETELAQHSGFQSESRHGKRTILLSTLQQRLFEISRRNRLLHFRPTMQTVNLTWASVPVSLDVKNIKPKQLLVCNQDLRKMIVGGKKIPLNRYLRFEEAIYLPSSLDRIRAEARREQAEFGVSGLRLVLCFFRWSNLKEQPHERFDSPLVLLPVELTKKKGIRDSWYLQPHGSEAEINPVLRYYLNQLYGLKLPETIDLHESSLEELHTYLEQQIHASEPAVQLEKIDRPRIQVIHAKARRRLDQYRRRAHISGRKVRTFGELEYSYEPENFHPLGLRIFQEMVRPPETSLHAILEDHPLRRTESMTAETSPDASGDPPAEKPADSGNNPPVKTTDEEKAAADDPPALPTDDASPLKNARQPAARDIERQMYRAAEEDDGNPYRWEFDLCHLTLGSLRSRKMSLVRDYTSLLDNGAESDAFEAVFSLTPREVTEETPELPPLAERFPVIASDPTQTASVEQARTGRSYIIQGPPGTGKSQTITNLIAHYAARGKRVLFVCEKRAAIDVVYHRLRQTGLEQLCCLIHDSQADKKSFIMELKATYESHLAFNGDGHLDGEVARNDVLTAIHHEAEPLEQFTRTMCETPADAGSPLHDLFQAAAECREHAPALTPLDRERLPSHRLWIENRPAIREFYETITVVQPEGIFARHPLHHLKTDLPAHERPLEFLTESLENSQRLIDTAATTLSETGGIDDPAAMSLATVGELVAHAERLQPLAAAGHLSLLDESSPAAREFAEACREIQDREAEVATAREQTEGWKVKLPPRETELALQQAQQYEGSFLRFFQPGWWQLRSVIRKSYDFDVHSIHVTWPWILENLQREHAAVARRDETAERIRRDYGFTGGPDEFLEQRRQLGQSLAESGPAVQALHAHLLTAPDATATVEKLVALRSTLNDLTAGLQSFLAAEDDGHDLDTRSLPQLAEDMTAMKDRLGDLSDILDGLKILARMPQPIVTAIRHEDLDFTALDAAVTTACVDEVCRRDRQFHRFTGAARNRAAERLAETSGKLFAVNAEVIRQRARDRFRENVRITGLPASQLENDQKEFKSIYEKGRRVLEHEFGKSMRYKSIRDLATGESGRVIADLKPVWLMSPLSVSDTLPLEGNDFDVVIFDEASQITLEEAVPSLFRARQTIVVGDEMQLPPTNFFGGKRSEEEDALQWEAEGGEVVEYDLGSNSFLNHTARNLPSTMLGRHYRSRSESLISFSNAAFYHGRLLTIPEESIVPETREEILIESPEEGDTTFEQLLDRPLSFHFQQHGIYESRRNRCEADYIAHMVRGLLKSERGLSIGIVAFSEAQQSEIEDALNRLGEDDEEFRSLLEAELEREEDDQYVGLLVKNLENIQGDERDIIILSVCYGPDAAGKMRMNFGPINQSGGEKRLNVAFSRAKHHMAVVSSIRSHAITNDYNDGANCLKNYLRYAETISRGDRAAARQILGEMSLLSDHRDTAKTTPVIEQISAALRDRGYSCEPAVGDSSFRCDLAIWRDGDSAYRLGLLLDSPDYYRNPDVMDRDVTRPQLLQAFGWNIAFVLSKDWYDNPEEVLTSLEAMLQE